MYGLDEMNYTFSEEKQRICATAMHVHMQIWEGDANSQTGNVMAPRETRPFAPRQWHDHVPTKFGARPL